MGGREGCWWWSNPSTNIAVAPVAFDLIPCRNHSVPWFFVGFLSSGMLSSNASSSSDDGKLNLGSILLKNLRPSNQFSAPVLYWPEIKWKLPMKSVELWKKCTSFFFLNVGEKSWLYRFQFFPLSVSYLVCFIIMCTNVMTPFEQKQVASFTERSLFWKKNIVCSTLQLFEIWACSNDSLKFCASMFEPRYGPIFDRRNGNIFVAVLDESINPLSQSTWRLHG